MNDYITRFRERFVHNTFVARPSHSLGETNSNFINSEDVEQFLTTLATEQFEAGKVAGKEDIIDYIEAECNFVKQDVLDGNDGYYEVRVGDLESVRNQKSI